MIPHDLSIIKKQLAEWGYPKELVRIMKPLRLLNCYQNEKVYQEYQEVKDKEYYARRSATV